MEAEGRSEIIRNDIKYLTDQLMSLKIEIEKAVRAIHESPQQLSIDPNKLLADMNNLIGDGSAMELEKNIDRIVYTRKEGVDDFFVKPLESETFIKRVEECLGG